MHTRTVEQVESWESRPFSGGFAALHELSDEGFSGAVVAGDTWLFMLNGRVVGVFEGDIDDYAEESGTVYDAPHDSLPLLFSMQERGGSTRAKYFTNDTSIREADQTLTDANFTGYVELSENVLSGDYYIVYYGGKQMSAAFIGQSERLVTGEEAYDRAADEVGIYEVKDVSMNITEIPAPAEPEPEESGGVAGAAAGASAGTDSDADASPVDSDAEQAADSDVESVVDEAESAGASGATSSEPGDTADRPTDASPEATESPSEAEAGADAASTGPQDQGTETGAAAGSDTPQEPDTGTGESERDPGTRTEDPGSGSAASGASAADADTDKGTARDTSTSGTGTASAPEAEDSFVESQDDSEQDELERMFQEEAEWRQTRSIPALDPDETEDTGEGSDSAARRRKQASGSDRQERAQSNRQQRSQPNRQQQSQSNRQQRSTASGPSSGVSEERVAELRQAIEAREEQIEELSESMDTVQAERDEMASELEQLRAERDDLEDRVSNLESALQRAKDEQASIDTTATELSPQEALAGTNLFVRYDSKGKPTLDALSGGEVDPEAVNANLQLEHHTQFETEDVIIDGEAFDTFLEATSAYQFVSWVVRELPYELLESGKRNALGDLYEAIPAIDRIEFEGTIDVQHPEGETISADFGVVMRDRMGNPLIVAELNDERDPVRGEEMSELIEAATSVGDVEDTLASAAYVTASFFEPAALESAEGAASSGGLFSRSDKASYVKTANKSGFHLVLVEDRAESFHVTVPEL